MASERKFVAENIRRVLLKEFFQKEVEMAGFGGIDIQRTPMGTRVTLIVERPGMVIGRKGAKIKDLTRKVSEVYGFDNPQIEVQECRDPSTNPQIMAQKLALALERGWHFRRAGHSTLRRIEGSSVKGCQVKLSGKLTGQRHRTEKFKWGHIKFCGEPAITAMDHGYAIAKKKLGLIGVSVDIMKPDAVLPDEIVIRDLPTVEEVARVSGEKPKAEKEDQPDGSEDDEDQKDTSEEGSEESENPQKDKEISKRKQKRKERQKAKEDPEESVSEEEASDVKGDVVSDPLPKESSDDGKVGKATKAEKEGPEPEAKMDEDGSENADKPSGAEEVSEKAAPAEGEK